MDARQEGHQTLLQSPELTKEYKEEAKSKVQSSKIRWFNKDLCGIFTIVLVYVLFIQIYTFTIIYSLAPGLKNNETSSIINLIIFTLMFIMALISHYQCVTTNPGVLPKDYEQLNEKNLSSKFAKLLDERESIYNAAQVRKQLRSGQLDENQKQELLQQLNKNSGFYNNEAYVDPKNSMKQEETNDNMNEMTAGGDQRHSGLNNDSPYQTKMQINDSKLPSPPLGQIQSKRKVFENNRTVSDEFFNAAKESISVKRNTYVDKIIQKQCIKCNSIRPPHAHHCNSCQRCIAYMDHHCPWINNCVGIYTQKVFVLFNFYTMVGIIYSLCINLTQGLVQLSQVQGRPMMNWSNFMQCLSILEAIAFGLFIIVVFFDQISIILNRLSTLDKVKLYENRLFAYKKRGCKNFRVTFGGPFSLKWFIPTTIDGVFEVEELYD